jgi:hypothetical protein
MSITNPDKFDNLIGNIEIIKDFLCDPEIRTNPDNLKYFVGLLEKNIVLLKELTEGIYG